MNLTRRLLALSVTTLLAACASAAPTSDGPGSDAPPIDVAQAPVISGTLISGCFGAEPSLVCARTVCTPSGWGFQPLLKDAPCNDVGACDGQMHCVTPVRPSSPELRASDYAEYAIAGFGGSTWNFGGTIVRAPLPNPIGRDANSTGRPIGGGLWYGDWFTPSGAVLVRSLTELTNALAAFEQSVRSAIAQHSTLPRQTVYVADTADIELGSVTLNLAPGLTLAGGRGRDRLEGAILRSSTDVYEPAFRLLTQADLGTKQPLPPVRITGLRFFGPNPTEDAPDCSSDGRRAIRAVEDGAHEASPRMVDRVVEVDNNELYAWPAVGVEIEGFAHGFVHHNYIHHSQRHADGVKCAVFNWSIHAKGYGVVASNARVWIEANRFDNNRHSIASTGAPLSDYVAMFNSVERTSGPSHVFDVHGGEDRDDGTKIAGRRIVIAYNSVFDDSQAAVNVRGNPTIGAWVVHNDLAGPSGSVEQTKTGDSASNMWVSDNNFNYVLVTGGGGGGAGSGGGVNGPHNGGGPGTVVHQN